MADELPVYPVVLRLSGIHCLIVGGATLALRKASALVPAGAKLTVIARSCSEELALLADTVWERDYEIGDAANYQLVFAATGIREVDEVVARDARESGVFANAVDQLGASSFILPAIFADGLVHVAVTTSGASPALASYLRDEIAMTLKGDAAFLAETLRRIRRALHDQGRTSEGRDWRGLIATVLAARHAEGDEHARAAGSEFAGPWFTENNDGRTT